MVRFSPDLGHSSLNVRKITGRSDMYPNSDVQNFCPNVRNVLFSDVQGQVLDRKKTTHSRPSRSGSHPSSTRSNLYVICKVCKNAVWNTLHFSALWYLLTCANRLIQSPFIIWHRTCLLKLPQKQQFNQRRGSLVCIKKPWHALSQVPHYHFFH